MTDAEVLQAEIDRINDDLKTLQPHIIAAMKQRDMPTASELIAAWSILNHDLAEVKEALRHV